MAKLIKTGMTVQQARELDNLRATVEKQEAIIDYLAIMTDVELPESGEEESHE